MFRITIFGVGDLWKIDFSPRKTAFIILSADIWPYTLTIFNFLQLHSIRHLIFTLIKQNSIFYVFVIGTDRKCYAIIFDCQLKNCSKIVSKRRKCGFCCWNWIGRRKKENRLLMSIHVLKAMNIARVHNETNDDIEKGKKRKIVCSIIVQLLYRIVKQFHVYLLCANECDWWGGHRSDFDFIQSNCEMQHFMLINMEIPSNWTVYGK